MTMNGRSVAAMAAFAWLVAATRGAQATPYAALGWQEVVAGYERVRDYTTIYEKEERAISNGEPQHIRLSFRKPLDVRMEWLDAQGGVDQVAVYRQGQNDGKLIAHRKGTLGSLVGTVRLDVHDKRALQDSRHPITEVGLGHLIAAVSRELRDGHATIGAPVEGK